MEVLQFKELGVNIRSFISMKSDDHSETFSDFLNRFKASLKNEIELKEQLLPDIYPFFNNEVEFLEKEEIWYNSIDQKYVHAMNLTIPDAETKEGGVYLCTVVDMGDIT